MWTLKLGSLLVVSTALTASVLVAPVRADAVAPAAGTSDFSCYASGLGKPRPIPQLKRQERIVARVRHLERPRFVVKRATPTHLGVVALVSGDVEAAVRAMPSVDHVLSWTGGFRSDLPPSMRMYAARLTFLNPVMHEVLREVRGIPGRVEPAFWVAGDAVVVEWKAPVPDEVLAVAGVRADGVEVRVVARKYSRADFDKAGDRLISWIDEQGLRWTGLSACPSGRGLSLGIPGRVRDFGATPEELAEAAGMPVSVYGGAHASFRRQVRDAPR